MEPIQIIAVIFAIFSLSRVLLRYKDGKVSHMELLFWIVTWASIILVALNPGVTKVFSDILGVERPIDFTVYVSIIVLFYLIFRVYVKLTNIEQHITEIVRNIAKKEKKK